MCSRFLKIIADVFPVQLKLRMACNIITMIKKMTDKIMPGCGELKFSLNMGAEMESFSICDKL